MSNKNNKWENLPSPNPPMFLGTKEKNLVKQINDQLIETVMPFQIVYFPIDLDRSTYHPLYKEAINKVFLSPIHVYCIVEWKGEGTETTNYGIDKRPSPLMVYFHKKRLSLDQNLYVRSGDFIQYGDNFYEIVDTNESRELFGDFSWKVEIVATCIKSREQNFDGAS